MSARRYSVGEERLNTATHAAGAVIALGGLILFFVLDFPRSTVAAVSVAIYGFTLIFLYAASAFYHGASDSGRKALLRRFDHAAIYLLIAGTYTPVLLGAVGGKLGWGLLGAVWILAFAGILKVIFAMERWPKLSLGLYLGMGWICLFAFGPMIAGMPVRAFALLLAGGISYTLGVFFYASARPYFHAVWHLFVLAGSILQFFAVVNLD